MSQLFDQAQQREERHRQESLARQKEKAKGHPGGSFSHCQDCGEPIPQARQEKVQGCTRCFTCQTEHERGIGR